MQRLPACALVGLTAFATFAGCSGGGSSPGNSGGETNSPTPPPIVTENYTFPSGDASASSGTAWDIIGIKTTLSGVNNTTNNSYNTLRVDVTFAQDISNALPAAGTNIVSGNQIGVGIFIDADGNPITGTDASCTTSRSFEFFSEEGTRLGDGNYAILGSGGAPTTINGNPGTEAITTISGHVLSQTFNLPTIGVFDALEVPHIGISAEVFNGAQQTSTDCVPDGSLDEIFTSQT